MSRYGRTGFLTGTVRSLGELPEDDFRRGIPRFLPGHLERNLELADRLRSLAEAKGATAAQLALAWVLARGEDVVPIPGTKHPKYLEENVAAAGIRLSGEELGALDSIFPPGAAAGERYSPSLADLIDR